MACVWLCGASPAWAYSNACSAVNSVGSINTSFSTPDLGGGPGVAATTAAGEVYTLTVTTTGGVTLSFVEIQVGSTVNTVANAGNGTVVSLTAAGGEALVKQNRGATSGSGTVTITVTDSTAPTFVVHGQPTVRSLWATSLPGRTKVTPWFSVEPYIETTSAPSADRSEAFISGGTRNALRSGCGCCG